MDSTQLVSLLVKLCSIEPVIKVPLGNPDKLLLETAHIAHPKQRLEAIAGLIDSMGGTHPSYGRLAGRVLAYALNTHGRIAPLSFCERMRAIDAIHISDGSFSRRVNPTILAFLDQHEDTINAAVKYEREYDYAYIGAVTARKVYLGFHKGEETESIEDWHMRVALQIAIGVTGRRATDRLSVCLQEYEDLSTHKKIYATPICGNSAYDGAQLSSCFLVNISDSIESIYRAAGDCAKIHAKMGGCAVSLQSIRGTGSIVRSTGGAAAGLIPFAKLFDHTSSIVMAGGRRSGSNAGWYEPHGLDVLDLLTARTQGGSDKNKLRTLFQGLFLSDLFLSKVFEEENADWYLLDPSVFPGLELVHSKEYEALYNTYAAQACEEIEREGVDMVHQESGVSYKTVAGRCSRVKAQDIYNAIKVESGESGVPFLIAKDAVNRRSQHSNRGTVKMSNLCTEIFEYVDENETAVCTLANVCLPSYVKKDGNGTSYFDFDELHAVTKRLCWGLNSVLDTQTLPLASAKKSNDGMRSIGIGLQGLADVFIMLRMAYGDSDSRVLNREIAETIHHAALEASAELAEDTQPYPHFKTNGGSYLAKGLFHHEVDQAYPHKLRWDWESLRRKIAETGVANSLTTAYAPTSTTSIVQNNQESFQATVSMITNRTTLAGDFLQVNEHLVRDLEAIGMWNEDTKDAILSNNGSVSSLDIPRTLKDIYKTAYEVSAKSMIEMLADRGYFVDQGQSFNIFTSNARDFSSFFDTCIYYGWKKNNKNLLYYNRQEPKTEALRVNVKEQSLGLSSSTTVLPLEEVVGEDIVPDSPPEGFICYREEGCVYCE